MRSLHTSCLVKQNLACFSTGTTQHTGSLSIVRPVCFQELLHVQSTAYPSLRHACTWAPSRASRPPSHFHLVGNTTTNTSAISGASCFQSYFKCVTIHGTSGALVQDTVAFDIQGNGFYLESGVEEHNVFAGNLAARISPVEPAMPPAEFTGAARSQVWCMYSGVSMLFAQCCCPTNFSTCISDRLMDWPTPPMLHLLAFTAPTRTTPGPTTPPVVGTLPTACPPCRRHWATTAIGSGSTLVSGPCCDLTATSPTQAALSGAFCRQRSACCAHSPT